MTGRLVVIREGHGELGSIENLVARVGLDLGVIPQVLASLPKSPRVVITDEESAVRAGQIAAKLSPDAALLTADLDDDCPHDFAPRVAARLRAEKFGFPVAMVFFHREFETMALSIAPALGGREIRSRAGQRIGVLLHPAAVPADPESVRDAKGWVGRNLMSGRSYKPTTHQYPLTVAMPLPELRAAGLSSFRRLEHAMQFLGEQVSAGTAEVYPPA